VLLLSAVFDLLDGALARATGRVSKFGALLDSTVDRASEAGRHWLREASQIPALVCDALLEDEVRPRTLITNNGVMSVLRGVNLNSDAELEDMVSLRLWVEEKRVIDLRHRKLREVSNVRDLLARGHGPTCAGDLLLELANTMIERMDPVVDHLEDEVETWNSNWTPTVCMKSAKRCPRFDAARSGCGAISRLNAMPSPGFELSLSAGRRHNKKNACANSSNRSTTRSKISTGYSSMQRSPRTNLRACSPNRRASRCIGSRSSPAFCCPRACSPGCSAPT
ncbi:MAG: CDP-alcohol phosphatidyltransferase family protein, partial [Myxococcales bacterium]|nr:CDP-alcohol phosphatidyltransferase family protein [Myxococcales bacterium]